jgi:hypothetical protein
VAEGTRLQSNLLHLNLLKSLAVGLCLEFGSCRPAADSFLRNGLDVASVDEVLHVSQGQQVPHLEHYGQANDLGRSSEVPKQAALSHQKR